MSDTQNQNPAAPAASDAEHTLPDAVLSVVAQLPAVEALPLAERAAAIDALHEALLAELQGGDGDR